MTRLLVDALAVYRLSRLVTRDVLTRGLRERVIERAYRDTDWTLAGSWTELVEMDDDPPKLATLISCGWCASVYLAFGAVVARRLSPRLWAPVAEALAFSAVAGLVSGLEGE